MRSETVVDSVACSISSELCGIEDLELSYFAKQFKCVNSILRKMRL